VRIEKEKPRSCRQKKAPGVKNSLRERREEKSPGEKVQKQASREKKKQHYIMLFLPGRRELRRKKNTQKDEKKYVSRCYEVKKSWKEIFHGVRLFQKEKRIHSRKISTIPPKS